VRKNALCAQNAKTKPVWVDAGKSDQRILRDDRKLLSLLFVDRVATSGIARVRKNASRSS
jgi:hypothetical protein